MSASMMGPLALHGLVGGRETGFLIVNPEVNGSFDVSTEDTDPRGLAFRDDGTRMFVVGNSSDSVYQYDLSSPWDVTTASLNGSFDLSTQDTSPEEIAFQPDGTRMFVAGDSSDSVYQYDLSTAWDVTTASANGSFDVSAEDAQPRGVAFRNDGTRMFVAGDQNDIIQQYDLSTAWDVTSASAAGSFNLSTGTQTDVEFSKDGDRMFAAQPNDVYQYTLSTAWDVTTAGEDGRFRTSDEDSSPTGVAFQSGNGLRMFIVGTSTDSVYQYDRR